MTDALLSQLFDFGALGVFAGFLIWQHLGMQRRLDSLTSSFQEQLREMDKLHDERIDDVRRRYGDVVENMRQETAQMQRDIVQKLDIALRKLDEGLDEARRIRRDGKG